MDKPKIFIISSGKARTLATQLKLQLDTAKIFSDVRLWFEASRFGETIIEMLKRNCTECDFAAAILTRDDVTLKNGDEFRAARDNCIFEAGLFTGALGLDLKRCFLVCAVESMALPSDLREIIYIRFDEPQNLDDPTRCSEEMQSVRSDIQRNVQEMKPQKFEHCRLSLVSKEELIEKEQLEPQGNLTRGAVVVNSAQPIEQKPQFAARIMDNMEAGVDYQYFFYGDPEGVGASFICELIQMISLARLLDGKKDRIRPAERLSH